MQGIELRSSGKVASALSHWAISSAPHLNLAFNPALFKKASHDEHDIGKHRVASQKGLVSL